MEVRFYKDAEGWFADVKGHTKAQNKMVAGADTLLDKMSNGKSDIRVTLFSEKDPATKKWLVKMTRFEHDPFGAAYLCKIKGRSIPWPAWLCNVTHTVFGGEHPKRIFITDIN